MFEKTNSRFYYYFFLKSEKQIYIYIQTIFYEHIVQNKVFYYNKLYKKKKKLKIK